MQFIHLPFSMFHVLIVIDILEAMDSVGLFYRDCELQIDRSIVFDNVRHFIRSMFFLIDGILPKQYWYSCFDTIFPKH